MYSSLLFILTIISSKSHLHSFLVPSSYKKNGTLLLPEHTVMKHPKNKRTMHGLPVYFQPCFTHMLHKTQPRMRVTTYNYLMEIFCGHQTSELKVERSLTFATRPQPLQLPLWRLTVESLALGVLFFLFSSMLGTQPFYPPTALPFFLLTLALPFCVIIILVPSALTH